MRIAKKRRGSPIPSETAEPLSYLCIILVMKATIINPLLHPSPGGRALKATCPICKIAFELPDDVVDGEIVEHDCGVTLEVKLVNGEVVLKPLEGVYEDWGE